MYRYIGVDDRPGVQVQSDIPMNPMTVKQCFICPGIHVYMC